MAKSDDRDDNVYMAKLAEQAERYDGKHTCRNVLYIYGPHDKLCRLDYAFPVLFFSLYISALLIFI